jgi:hypothetical protein
VAPGRFAQFGPDGLARGSRARGDAPVVCERVHEEQATTGLGYRVGSWGSGRRSPLGTGVGHLDAEHALGQGELEVKVPAGDMAVAYRVRGEFCRDEGERFVDGSRVGVTPVVQAVRDEPAG